jgi:hypothetical protein
MSLLKLRDTLLRRPSHVAIMLFARREYAPRTSCARRWRGRFPLDLTLRNPPPRYPVARAQPANSRYADAKSQPISIAAMAKYYAVWPDGAPAWGVRFVLTFLFPK